MGRGRLALVSAGVMAAVLAVSGIAGAAQSDGALGPKDLAYKGAKIAVQIDVNGVAAVQLIGGALDAAAAQVQAAAAEGAGGAEGPMAMLPAAAPVIGPAMDIVKSVTRITVLVMKPDEGVSADSVIAHYSGMLTPRGWSPLATVREEKGTGILAMLAPGGKGVFASVKDNNELVVAMVTTSKPIGDLLGEVVKASGGSLPAIIGSIGKGPKPAPEPACEESEKEQETEEAE